MVRDSDGVGSEVVAQRVLPVTQVRSGYRIVPLHSANCVPLRDAYLFVDVTVTSLTSHDDDGYGDGDDDRGGGTTMVAAGMGRPVPRTQGVPQPSRRTGEVAGGGDGGGGGGGGAAGGRGYAASPMLGSTRSARLTLNPMDTASPRGSRGGGGSGGGGGGGGQDNNGEGRLRSGRGGNRGRGSSRNRRGGNGRNRTSGVRSKSSRRGLSVRGGDGASSRSATARAAPKARRKTGKTGRASRKHESRV